MLTFLKKIVIGPGEEKNLHQPVSLKENYFGEIKTVWDDLTLPSYGLERIIRLVLVLIQFCYPSFLIRVITASASLAARKLAADSYVLLKLFLLILILGTNGYNNICLIFLSVYLTSETIFYLLGLIFLNDIYPSKASFARSMVMLIINYFEVTLGFAVLYAGVAVFNIPLNPVSAVYFSLVTTTTLGFGDYFPSTSAGQIIVIIQLFVFVLFVLLFINYFTLRVGNKNNSSV